MARLILEDKDIKDFEEKINSLPCFAKNVSENMAVYQAIQALMNWMGTKIEQEEEKKEVKK